MKEFFQSLTEIINALYNQYVLRDFLGYILPGSLIILNVNYYYNFENYFVNRIERFEFLKKYYFPFFFIGSSYVVGNMVAGFFFNMMYHVEWWPWRYMPLQFVPDNRTQMYLDMDLRTAYGILGNAGTNLAVERLVLLMHLTGYGSATLLIIAIINSFFIRRFINTGQISKGIFLIVAPIIVSVGIYQHYRQLCERAFFYKIAVIGQGKYLEVAQREVDSAEVKKYLNDTTLKLVKPQVKLHRWYYSSKLLPNQ